MRFSAILPVLLISGCALDGEPDDVGSVDEATHNGIPHLKVLSMTPARNSHTAGPLATIHLTFNMKVDMSTVDDSTVWMTHREARGHVPIVIAPGATAKELDIVPVLPLATGSRYWINVNGVTAQVPSEEAVFAQRFYTAFHEATHYERFAQATGMNLYFDAAYDPVTRIRTVNRWRPGPDHMIGGGDDVVSFRSEYRYDAQGDNRRLLVREAPGTDGDFGTPDDVILYDRFFSWDGRGLVRGFTQRAGSDGLLNTTDDYDTAVFRRTYDPDTDVLLLDCDYDSGPDLNAFSADDTIMDCSRTFDQPGNTRWTLTSIGPGMNGTWGDDDDVLDSPYRIAYLDGSGRVYRSEAHALAGTEAIPSEATLAQVLLHTYDDDTDLVVQTREFVGAGTDMTWDTADDVGEDMVTYTYDSEGFVTGEVDVRAGGDGEFGTGDDWVFETFDY